MQDKHLYEYAIIRVLPKVEREEFINVGLIMFCKRKKFIQFKYEIPQDKIRAFCKDFDLEQLELHLKGFELTANGGKNGGPIGAFEISERFRWLTAIKSSCIQTSRPHPGLTENLEQTFNDLYQELVS